MHITFLLSASLDSPYGKGRCVPVARELAAQGERITILTLHHDWERCTTRRFTIPTDGLPIEVVYVGQMAVRKRDSKKTYFPAWQLLWVLMTGFWGFVLAGMRLQTDALHVGKAQPVNGLAGWLISRLKRRPLFVDCDDYEAVANHFSNPWQARLVAAVEDWLPRQARGITVNTTFLAERYIRMGYPRQRIVQVPNGVPEMPSADAQLPASLATIRAAIPETTPIVLYVGTLALESHPIELLLDAFQILTHDYPAAHLLIVGGGPDADKIHKMARPLAGRVWFTGQVSPDDALAAYQLATVTVDPVYDNDVCRARCPLKLMESLAAGVPIVTGDVGDRRVWLGDSFTEWLVAPGSADALAEGLATVIHAQQSKRWGTTEIQRRAENFAWDTLATTWRRVYKGIVS